MTRCLKWMGLSISLIGLLSSTGCAAFAKYEASLLAAEQAEENQRLQDRDRAFAEAAKQSQTAPPWQSFATPMPDDVLLDQLADKGDKNAQSLNARFELGEGVVVGSAPPPASSNRRTETGYRPLLVDATNPPADSDPLIGSDQNS